MSVFGYGRDNQPNPYGQSPFTPGQLPGYMSQNFMPEVTEAWKNPTFHPTPSSTQGNLGLDVLGYQAGGMVGPIGASAGDWFNANNNRSSGGGGWFEPWRNPFAENFRSTSSPDQASLPVSRNAPELYNNISNMNTERLQQLTAQLPDITKKFQTVAQEYSNAYANPMFRMVTPENGRMRNVSQQENSDVLKSAYELLLNRMNAGYLL